ncbi:acireductone synthase [Micromonospora eburnea]|uniref:Multifunctional fusion protein n=1 Tax=Micromonospora eburnea TaxID=227316 RepID=A0A1C6UVB2_9ACTN|nr:acireductone synthase [Micromonospora eburnea]SCL57896.1 methylthioribulose-1-phosphate dehydratase [Micromonospora eburnea]
MTVGVDLVLLDIEGTLTPTKQVHSVLYDYARPRLGPWLDEHADSPAVAEVVARVRSLAGLAPDAGTGDVLRVLHGWMDADEKIAPLKTLQGLIWQRGYATGELVTEFFADVAPALRAWHAAGLRLAVFSSGSVTAQLAAFSRTTDGDVTGLFSGHFDTVTAGPKRDESSYRAITAALDVDPARAVFLTDVPEESAAAAAAGWRTVGVARPGEPYHAADFGAARTVASFDDLAFVPAALLAAGRELAAEAARYAGLGWMPGTSGNLSVVLDRDPLRLAVTASGVDKGELTATDVVMVDAYGEPVSAGVPSAEAGLHARIAAVAGAGAVVHVHALAPVLAAERWPDGVRLSGLEMLKGVGRGAHDDPVTIPVIANGQDMGALGDAFERGFRSDVPALIVARHGVYVWGADLRQARHRLECLEWLLRFALATTNDDPTKEL